MLSVITTFSEYIPQSDTTSSQPKRFLYTYIPFVHKNRLFLIETSRIHLLNTIQWFEIEMY